MVAPTHRCSRVSGAESWSVPTRRGSPPRPAKHLWNFSVSDEKHDPSDDMRNCQKICCHGAVIWSDDKLMAAHPVLHKAFNRANWP